MNRAPGRRLSCAALLVGVALLASCATNEPATQSTPDPEDDSPPTPTSTASGAAVASTAAIPTDELPRVRFVAPDGREATLPLEVPPRDEYSIGLSGRHELEGRGMLFYYPSGEHTGGFWMRGTFVDLDIAFVGADLEVLEVLRMEAETEQVHRPQDPYLAAIEAPAGWFAEHGIGPGARVEFLFEIPGELR